MKKMKTITVKTFTPDSTLLAAAEWAFAHREGNV